MNASEPIALYLCNSCTKAVYQDRIEVGLGCENCGSKTLRNAPPTFKYVSGYLLHNPHLILRFIKENVLRIGTNA